MPATGLKTQLLEDDETHKKFLEQLITTKDDTLKLCYQFKFIDYLCYLSLHLAIRSSNCMVVTVGAIKKFTFRFEITIVKPN